MAGDLMRVTGVIPTYNERLNIEKLVVGLNSAVPDLSLVIVDDQSPDGTAEEVRRMQGEYPGIDLLVRSGKLGFGSAYLEGFQRALRDPQVEAVLMMDADLSHDPAVVPSLIERLADCDVVIGSRYVKNGRVEGWPAHRRLLSRFGNLYARTITRMHLRDCTAGFMLLRRPVVERLLASPPKLTGYAFLMEIKYKVWTWKLCVREFPIVFRNRIQGQSKISSGIIQEGILAPWILRKH
jgi:dolichol-phosphate mannosyltransferase